MRTHDVVPIRSHPLARSRAVDPCPVEIYCRTLSPRSIVVVREALRLAASTLTAGRILDPGLVAWERLRLPDVVAVRAALLNRLAPEPARSRLSCLKQVLKSCWRLGLMSAEDYHRAVDVPPIRSRPMPAGRYITLDERAALLEACRGDETLRGPRDAALLCVFHSAVRVSELARIELRDWHPEEGAVMIRRGKGGQPRWAYVPPALVSPIRCWVGTRGAWEGALICATDIAGAHVVHRGLCVQSIEEICERRARQAGIAHFTPHDMRRTVATDLRSVGQDFGVIKEALGHASINTTYNYFRGDVEAAKRAASACQPTPHATTAAEGGETDAGSKVR